MPSSSSPVHRLLTWLGGHEFGVLASLAALAAGIWIFALLANEVNAGATDRLDRSILLSMRRGDDLHPIGPPWFRESVRDVTALGSAAILGLVTAITAGFLVLDGKRRMAVFVLACVLGGAFLSTFLKGLFHRARPTIVPHEVTVTSTSFPSGHSMLSALTFLTLGALLARSHERRRMKAYLLFTAVLLTTLVGISRVYLGVHWPTDVIGGWTAGSVWALLCWMVAQRLQLQHTLETETEHNGSS